MLVSDVRAQLRDICVKVTVATLYFSVCPQTDFAVHQVPGVGKRGFVVSLP